MLWIIAYSPSPPDGYAGDPPSNRYCTVCHSGTLDSGPGYVRVLGIPDLYYPDSTYELTLVVFDGTASRFGCQMVAKDTSGNVVGTFTAVGPNTRVSSSGYASHDNAPYSSDSFAFVFRYQPPATYSGPIIIYAVGNAADGDGTAAGDNVYSFTDTMFAAVSVSEMPNDDDVRLFGRILSVRAKGDLVEVLLYTKEGRSQRLFSGLVIGKREIRIPSGGVVLVRIGKRVRVVKVL
ncbi:MAG: hypothetical protein GXO39_07170 [Thermotogae bacterium]|nr:hypothetical protein [Thermotogota bacterium]